MNVVDSSAWLEYFADSAAADTFAGAIEATGDLVVPTICLYEVFQRTAEQRGEAAAHQVTAAMRRGRVVPLDAELALLAAQTAEAEQLSLADAVILATAGQARATLWTHPHPPAPAEPLRRFALTPMPARSTLFTRTAQSGVRSEATCSESVARNSS